jgi:hypothetical protein
MLSHRRGIGMKKRVMFAMTPLILGILLLAYVMSNPRFEAYQGSDVWILVGSGALLAVGLGGLFGRVKLPGD